MKIEFHLEAQLRTVSGHSRVSMDAPEGCTLHEAVRRLADGLDGSIRPHLLNESGAVRSSLLIVVNGESVYADEAAALKLPESAEILLMPPIAGG